MTCPVMITFNDTLMQNSINDMQILHTTLQNRKLNSHILYPRSLFLNPRVSQGSVVSSLQETHHALEELGGCLEQLTGLTESALKNSVFIMRTADAGLAAAMRKK